MKTLTDAIMAIKGVGRQVDQLREQVRRWQRAPKYGPGGGACDCPEAWLIEIKTGQPSTGSFLMSVDLTDGTANITVPHNASRTILVGLFDGNETLADANVTIYGGPLSLTTGILIKNDRPDSSGQNGGKVTDIYWQSSTFNTGEPYITKLFVG
jgi:hypothetical protein